jgi:propanediol dehydratase small subunit
MASETRYPLGDQPLDAVHTATGKPVDQITLDAVLQGRVSATDLRISGETLRKQADIAEQAGFKPFAENLRRAAELVDIPDDELMRIYTALRPLRSTYAELSALADELERGYGAVRMAGLIRAAAEAYAARGMTREGNR